MFLGGLTILLPILLKTLILTKDSGKLVIS